MKIKTIDSIMFYTPKKQPSSRPISDDLFHLCGEHFYHMQIWTKNKWHTLEITIPDLFLWDKRSVPKMLRAIRPRDGLCELAALIHDALYRTAGASKNKDLGVVLTVDNAPATLARKACDQLYKHVYNDTKNLSSEPERDYFWLRLLGKRHFGKRTPPSQKK
jgi:hypothetical protein